MQTLNQPDIAILHAQADASHQEAAPYQLPCLHFALPTTLTGLTVPNGINSNVSSAVTSTFVSPASKIQGHVSQEWKGRTHTTADFHSR